MKKRTLCLAVSVFLVMLLSVCVGCADTSLYNAGTYEAIANGKEGEFSVTTEFSDDEILSIVIGDNNETEGVGSVAAEELPGKIVEAQGIEVDTISGATITSNAILDAASDCIEQARR
ncbi:MAG: FMN-binding protein [Coriobacteriales bacterium]|nr:FMN-binding protein [Coriobacteriales bacterium]